MKLFGQPNINALTNTYENTCLFYKILFYLMVPMAINCDSFFYSISHSTEIKNSWVLLLVLPLNTQKKTEL